MKNLLWYFFVGTRGGETRIKIVMALKERPMNAHQLAKKLSFDYKTVQHHLRTLYENAVLSSVNEGKYGAVYFISEIMQKSWNDFGEIWDRLGKK